MRHAGGPSLRPSFELGEAKGQRRSWRREDQKFSSDVFHPSERNPVSRVPHITGFLDTIVLEALGLTL